MQGFLTDYTKLSVGLAYGTGTADREGALVDMKGWDGVLIIAQFAEVATGGANSIKAQQGALSNGTDMADLLGTAQTIPDTFDGKIAYIDVYQPSERYVRVFVDKDTSNVCAETVTYLQYKGVTNPTAAQGSNVSGEQHASPAEGTA